MNAWNDMVFIIGLSIGGAAGVAVTALVAGLTGFFSDIRKEWQDGRQVAELVKEKNQERRVELLGKLIELQRAMQPVASGEPLIASQEPPVSELATSRRDDAPIGEDNAGHRAALPRP